MLRRLLTLLSSLSLLLCLAMAVFSIRSYYTGDSLQLLLVARAPETPVYRYVGIVSSLGGFGLSYAWESGDKPRTIEILNERPPMLQWWRSQPEQRPFLGGASEASALNRLGFGATHSASGDGEYQEWTVTTPYACVIFLLALLPAIWCVRRWRRHHRARLGLCPTCSYDLRASKGICPECGSPIPASIAARHNKV